MEKKVFIKKKMKFWEQEHTFTHSWEKVTTASWRKYNNNQTPILCPHVVSTDVISRSTAVPGVLSTTRLISLVSALPSWLGTLLGVKSNIGYVYETSEVNYNTKVMVLKSVNITFSNLITVEETCTYAQHPENPNLTTFKQEACITANFSKFASKIENTMLDRFTTTARKGKETLEKVIQIVVQEHEELSRDFNVLTSQLILPAIGAEPTNNVS